MTLILIYSYREESFENGFVLADNIGLRLKAIQYWLCNENGIKFGPNCTGPDQPIRIVIAEPLLHIGMDFILNLHKLIQFFKFR